MPDDNLLQVRSIAAYDDNYIWLISDKHCAVVVDPGDAAPVIQYLTEHHLTLTTILITHHHADHIGGVANLLAWCASVSPTKPVVYGPAHEDISVVTEQLIESDVVSISSPACKFAVLDVPGHTAGHIAFYLNVGEQRHVFCGDTLFATGCGRLFEGTPAQMVDSLNKLKNLPDQTLVHCAHEYTLSNIKFALAVEPHNQKLLAWQQTAQTMRKQGVPTVPTTIAHEKSVNPFLRCEEVSVIESVKQHQAIKDTHPVTVFAHLRSWKDTFKA
jgi:hydroxyacylglutathione hydrolase